ncbi:MAG: peptidylprolyl isomerase [Atopobiaceae bacterium]|nr:peptidylprolyl isomerase [Atopobiaceae bacterium]
MKFPKTLVGVLCAIAVFAFALGLSACSQPADSTSSDTPATQEAPDTQEAPETQEEPDGQEGSDMQNPYSTGIHHAEIVIRDYGTVRVELNANIAPITVANFARLADEGFYSGTVFHRIIPGFMAQGGADLFGSQPSIVGEFSENGRPNTISHVRGVISMARAQDYNSASTQFFICHGDASYLDGNYAAFGRVTSGMEVIDEIMDRLGPTDRNGVLLYEEDMPVIESVTMID